MLKIRKKLVLGKDQALFLFANSLHMLKPGKSLGVNSDNK